MKCGEFLDWQRNISFSRRVCHYELCNEQIKYYEKSYRVNIWTRDLQDVNVHDTAAGPVGPIRKCQQRHATYYATQRNWHYFLRGNLKHRLLKIELIKLVLFTPHKRSLRLHYVNWYNTKNKLTLEGPCIIFAIYIQSNEIHNVVAPIKFLLVLRCQLYMLRTVTFHPQELLCRYCMCRLWYVVRDALSDTSSWYNSLGRVLPQTLYQLDVSARTIVCTYSIYKEAPEDGPLRSETCRAETWVLIKNLIIATTLCISLDCIYIAKNKVEEVWCIIQNTEDWGCISKQWKGESCM